MTKHWGDGRMKISYTIIKIATVCTVAIAIFLLTGCVSDRNVNTDMTVRFDSFLEYSLGEYRIVRRRSRSRIVMDQSFGALPLMAWIRIRGTEWTLAYTEHTGQQRRLTFNNLYSANQSAAQRFSNAVLGHAEATVRQQSRELLREHFTRREIRNFSITIEIERVGRFNAMEHDLINAQTGLSLANLTPYDLFAIVDYAVTITTRVPPDDLRQQQGLISRFEDFLYDAILHFNDESLYLSYFNIALLRYDAESGAFVWHERMNIW